MKIWGLVPQDPIGEPPLEQPDNAHYEDCPAYSDYESICICEAIKEDIDAEYAEQKADEKREEPC